MAMERGDEQDLERLQNAVRDAVVTGDKDAARRAADAIEKRFEIEEWKPQHIHFLLDASRFRIASGPQSVYRRCTQTSRVQNRLGGWFVKVVSTNKHGNNNYEYVPHPIFVHAYACGNGMQVPIFTSLRSAKFANLVIEEILFPRIPTLASAAVRAVDAHM